jgi:hypothetical protein
MTRSSIAWLAASVIALAISSMASGQNPPRRVVWSGTISTANGATGTFVAHTRFLEGPDEGSSEYLGRFRCRGSACRAHHGRIDLAPSIATNRISGVLFRDPRTRCFYTNDAPPPDLGIDGTYRCYSATFTLMAEGALHLMGTVRR